jgi:hypothetical protein
MTPARQRREGSFGRGLAVLAVLALAGCSTPPENPNPPMTPSDRMSLQNECAKIADRSEREACLERAAFDPEW